MNINVEWGDDAKTYLHMTFYAGWSWDDFYTMTKDANAMLDSVDYQVHELLDFRQTKGSMPPNLITHFRKVALDAHPNRGAVILLSPRLRLVRAFANIILKFLPATEKYHIVSTIEDAHDTLSELATEPGEQATDDEQLNS